MLKCTKSQEQVMAKSKYEVYPVTGCNLDAAFFKEKVDVTIKTVPEMVNNEETRLFTEEALRYGSYSEMSRQAGKQASNSFPSKKGAKLGLPKGSEKYGNTSHGVREVILKQVFNISEKQFKEEYARTISETMPIAHIGNEKPTVDQVTELINQTHQTLNPVEQIAKWAKDPDLKAVMRAAVSY